MKMQISQMIRRLGLALASFVLVLGMLSFAAYADDDEDSVKSIAFKPAKPVELAENANGDWLDEEEGQFYYDLRPENIFHQGDQMTITYGDRERTYTYVNRDFVCDGEEDVFGLSFTVESDQSDENIWKKGNSYEVTLEYRDARTSVPVKIVANPLKKISYVLSKPIEIPDHSMGSYYKDLEDAEYYEYEAYRLLPQDGDQIELTYDEGKKVYTYQKDKDAFLNGSICLDGYYTYDDDQREVHWEKDKDNIMLFRYGGLEAEIPVTIIDNIVSKIQFKPARDIEFVENAGGFWFDDEYMYDIYGELHQIGARLVVSYKDGSEKTFTYDEYTDKDDNFKQAFVNGTESVEIDYTRNYDEEWVAGHTYEISVEYHGVQTKVPVRVLKNEGDSILKISIPLNTYDVTTGDIYPLEPVILPESAANEPLIWKSSNEKVALVDKDGKVTAISAGNAIITVTTKNGKTASCKFIAEMPEEVQLKTGDTYQLKAYSENPAILQWKSSDESVAVVDTNGKVTAVGAGEAILSVMEKDQKLVLSKLIVTLSDKDKARAEEEAKAKAEAEVKARAEAEAKAKAEAEAKAKAEAEGNANTETASLIEQGKVYTVGKYQYKVTNTDASGNGTAVLVGTLQKKTKLTKLTVPAAVTINGISLKVTEIGSNAFKGFKKLKSVTIGKNVTAIGKSAFQNDKKLKTITVKSNVLNKVGKNAIKGIYKKAKIKVPKAKMKAYKKLFKKSTGFTKKMKIRK